MNCWFVIGLLTVGLAVQHVVYCKFFTFSTTRAHFFSGIHENCLLCESVATLKMLHLFSETLKLNQSVKIDTVHCTVLSECFITFVAELVEKVLRISVSELCWSMTELVKKVKE